MISLKKVIVAAAVATLSFGLFAQISKTKVATAGLFDTDVDNFVSVTEWSTVKPEKFFGYFGMDDGYYNVGFAKQFEKFYWGTYYDGDIGSSSKKTYDAKTTPDTETTNWGNLRFVNLFGFGNIGVNATILLSGSKSVSDDKDAKVTTTTDTTSFYGRVNAGLNNYALGKFNTKPYAYIKFDTNYYGSQLKEVTHQDTEDNRTKMFGLGAGAEVILSETETTKQSAGVEFGFTNFTPYDSDRANKKIEISLPLSYKVTYKASDKLSLGFLAAANTTYSTSENSKAKTKNENFDFTPFVSAGVTYDTQKKVILNAGVSFDVPSYSNTKTDTDGKVDTTSSWDGSDGNLTYSSGFNWVPTKNISVDCSYEILQHLFGNESTTQSNTTGDMNSNLKEGDSKNFWETVNGVLVHNVGFIVSVKF